VQLIPGVAALVLAVFLLPAAAQEEQPENKVITREDIINYIADEKVVAPGVGFINGQLGDSMTYILEVWGEPASSRKTGILGSVEFLYRPDPNTMVVFTGKDEVKSISIKGNSASLLRTRRGARFGFTPINVARIYSRYEHKTVRERMEYPDLGISFYVDRKNRVDTMVIFESRD
jgi:hypothetical protein